MTRKRDTHEWFTATVVAEDKMCPAHRELLHTMPPDVQAERERYVGRQVEVRIALGVSDPTLEGKGPRHEHLIDSAECLPLVVRKAAGEEAGCFSCEVALVTPTGTQIDAHTLAAGKGN